MLLALLNCSLHWSQSVPTGPYIATITTVSGIGLPAGLSQSVPTGPYIATTKQTVHIVELAIVSIGPNGTVLCNVDASLPGGCQRHLRSLNRSQRDRTLQHLETALAVAQEYEKKSQSVPTGPYFAATSVHGFIHAFFTSVSIGPNGTVLCSRLFCDCDDHFTRNSLLINCLQINLPTSSKFDESVSPPSHSLAVFVIRSFRPPGLCLGSHHPPRTTYKSIKPTGPIQGSCR